MDENPIGAGKVLHAPEGVSAAVFVREHLQLDSPAYLADRRPVSHRVVCRHGLHSDLVPYMCCCCFALQPEVRSRGLSIWCIGERRHYHRHGRIVGGALGVFRARNRDLLRSRCGCSANMAGGLLGRRGLHERRRLAELDAALVGAGLVDHETEVALGRDARLQAVQVEGTGARRVLRDLLGGLQASRPGRPVALRAHLPL
mmetsp:Transcript_101565/g.284773  ORF Transcript_101565/g.284773 Transcript_101565/m.284773 type:complete len:201 (+) Transcript_101565:800-1402(+)